MIFTNKFTTDIHYCGRMDLDWNTIEKDLLNYVDEQSLNLSAVDHDFLKSVNPELYKKQSQCKDYGYTKHNTCIWKTTNQNPKIEFDWEADINQKLPLSHAICTVTRQDPGQVLPWHQDGFYYQKNAFPNETLPIWRYLVFLTDWKVGHYVQFGDTVYPHWQRGDTIAWHPDTWHVTANAGLETKWTANITGFHLI